MIEGAQPKFTFRIENAIEVTAIDEKLSVETGTLAIVPVLLTAVELRVLFH
jgi:hypothetical protein